MVVKERISVTTGYSTLLRTLGNGIMCRKTFFNHVTGGIIPVNALQIGARRMWTISSSKLDSWLKEQRATMNPDQDYDALAT